MGAAGTSEGTPRQRPPVTSGDRSPAVPFARWASGNRLKVVVSLLGGVIAFTGNSLASTLLRIETPDRPGVALVQIETGDDVCWTTSLGLTGTKKRDCGDASFSLHAESGDEFETADVEGKFFATVTKTFRTDVNARRVTIILLVEGREVDRASTTLGTATVAY